MRLCLAVDYNVFQHGAHASDRPGGIIWHWWLSIDCYVPSNVHRHDRTTQCKSASWNFVRINSVVVVLHCFIALLYCSIVVVCSYSDSSGVFRIWQSGGPWRARGARAYNGGLGAEPLAGSRGRAPRGVRGRSPPEAETLFASECSMKTANSPMFLKFGNAKDHQTLLNFAILAKTWQKTHLFI